MLPSINISCQAVKGSGFPWKMRRQSGRIDRLMDGRTDRRTERWTKGWTGGPTNGCSYWDARTHPKSGISVVIAAPLICFGRTIGRMTMKSTHTVLGHSLLCSYSLAPHTHLLSPHCSLCLRAPQFVQPLTRSTTHSHPSSWERGFVHELNASISCCFNPLWDAHLCVCVCVCAFRYPSSLLLP